MPLIFRLGAGGVPLPNHASPLIAEQSGRFGPRLLRSDYATGSARRRLACCRESVVKMLADLIRGEPGQRQRDQAAAHDYVVCDGDQHGAV